MFKFLKSVLTKLLSAKKLEYDAQKELAHHGNLKERQALAKDPDTNIEILYYLAQNDTESSVRQAVASNVTTPAHASTILAQDNDGDVRLALAKRLVLLLPELSKDEQSQIYAFTVQALGALALDEVINIRVALSTALKDSAYAPPKVVSQLAKDIEREVSEPILRFCVALSDDELIKILEEHPAEWAVEAIASRKVVSEDVSRAVFDTDYERAGTLLLTNEGADISTELLEEIIKKAKHFPEWHKPIACHKKLSEKAAKALSEFAELAIRDVLMKREDFDKALIEEIGAVFKRRLEAAHGEKQEQEPLNKAKALLKEKALNEDTISDALAMQERDFVLISIALLAKTDLEAVTKIIDMKAAKPIISLCWKAGFTMRFALKLQQELARVPHKELIYPKDGTDYPLTEEEMIWQLDFLGIKAA
jgi:uncharacterized protein (DUF2336 family)